MKAAVSSLTMHARHSLVNHTHPVGSHIGPRNLMAIGPNTFHLSPAGHIYAFSRANQVYRWLSEDFKVKSGATGGGPVWLSSGGSCLSSDGQTVYVFFHNSQASAFHTQDNPSQAPGPSGREYELLLSATIGDGSVTDSFDDTLDTMLTLPALSRWDFTLPNSVHGTTWAHDDDLVQWGQGIGYGKHAILSGIWYSSNSYTYKGVLPMAAWPNHPDGERIAVIGRGTTYTTLLFINPSNLPYHDQIAGPSPEPNPLLELDDGSGLRLNVGWMGARRNTGDLWLLVTPWQLDPDGPNWKALKSPALNIKTHDAKLARVYDNGGTPDVEFFDLPAAFQTVDSRVMRVAYIPQSIDGNYSKIYLRAWADKAGLESIIVADLDGLEAGSPTAWDDTFVLQTVDPETPGSYASWSDDINWANSREVAFTPLVTPRVPNYETFIVSDPDPDGNQFMIIPRNKNIASPVGSCISIPTPDSPGGMAHAVQDTEGITYGGEWTGPQNKCTAGAGAVVPGAWRHDMGMGFMPDATRIVVMKESTAMRGLCVIAGGKGTGAWNDIINQTVHLDLHSGSARVTQTGSSANTPGSYKGGMTNVKGLIYTAYGIGPGSDLGLHPPHRVYDPALEVWATLTLSYTDTVPPDIAALPVISVPSGGPAGGHSEYFRSTPIIVAAPPNNKTSPGIQDVYVVGGVAPGDLNSLLPGTPINQEPERWGDLRSFLLKVDDIGGGSPTAAPATIQSLDFLSRSGVPDHTAMIEKHDESGYIPTPPVGAPFVYNNQDFLGDGYIAESYDDVPGVVAMYGYDEGTGTPSQDKGHVELAPPGSWTQVITNLYNESTLTNRVYGGVLNRRGPQRVGVFGRDDLGSNRASPFANWAHDNSRFNVFNWDGRDFLDEDNLQMMSIAAAAPGGNWGPFNIGFVEMGKSTSYYIGGFDASSGVPGSSEFSTPLNSVVKTFKDSLDGATAAVNLGVTMATPRGGFACLQDNVGAAATILFGGSTETVPLAGALPEVFDAVTETFTSKSYSFSPSQRVFPMGVMLSYPAEIKPNLVIRPPDLQELREYTGAPQLPLPYELIPEQQLRLFGTDFGMDTGTTDKVILIDHNSTEYIVGVTAAPPAGGDIDDWESSVPGTYIDITLPDTTELTTGGYDFLGNAGQVCVETAGGRSCLATDFKETFSVTCVSISPLSGYIGTQVTMPGAGLSTADIFLTDGATDVEQTHISSAPEVVEITRESMDGGWFKAVKGLNEEECPSQTFDILPPTISDVHSEFDNSITVARKGELIKIKSPAGINTEPGTFGGDTSGDRDSRDKVYFTDMALVPIGPANIFDALRDTWDSDEIITYIPIDPSIEGSIKLAVETPGGIAYYDVSIFKDDGTEDPEWVDNTSVPDPATAPDESLVPREGTNGIEIDIYSYRLGNGLGLSGEIIMFVSPAQGSKGNQGGYVDCNIISWTMDQTTFQTTITVEAPEYTQSGYLVIKGADGREIVIRP